MDSLIDVLGEYKKNDPDKALQIGLAALSISEQNNLQDKIVESNYHLGLIYIQKGDYKSALDYFSKNLKSGITTSNSNFISRASINMANIYMAQGKYNSALDRYLAALKITESGKDKDLLYVNYLCLGITYYYLKNYSKSLEFYEKCSAIEKEKGEPAKMAYTYNAMGVIYKETGNYKKATEFLERTQKIALQSGDSSILSHNLGNLGEVYGLEGNFEKAKTFLEQGLAIQNRLKDDKGIGESLIHLGNLQLKFNKAKEAITYYTKALEVGERIGISDIIKDANKGLSESYSELKDFKKALDYQKAFSMVKDSLFNSTSSMQIADMQTRYETDKKEQENILLTKENDIKGLEIDKQKSQRNVLVVTFLVIILLGGLVYNSTRLSNRNKILAEKELRNMAVFQAQEKEKMQLSKELHDGLGPLLSLIKLNVSSIKTEPESEKMLSEVKELTTESIKEVRNISHALAPSLLQKQGLEAALNEFLDQVKTSGTLQTELEYSVKEKLSPETEINFYRIVQEAVNNVIKHAEANKVWISIKGDGSEIEFRIIDNGKGFLVDKTRSTNGNGMNNIYSRVDFLKGQLVINSNEGKGTQFIISIPLNKNA